MSGEGEGSKEQSPYLTPVDFRLVAFGNAADEFEQIMANMTHSVYPRAWTKVASQLGTMSDSIVRRWPPSTLATRKVSGPLLSKR